MATYIFPVWRKWYLLDDGICIGLWLNFPLLRPVPSWACCDGGSRRYHCVGPASLAGLRRAECVASPIRSSCLVLRLSVLAIWFVPERCPDSWPRGLVPRTMGPRLLVNATLAVLILPSPCTCNPAGGVVFTPSFPPGLPAWRPRGLQLRMSIILYAVRCTFLSIRALRPPQT